MTYFLAKTDPQSYPVARFQQERHATWDGVTHPTAVAAIKAMKPGDRVFVYHSGGESAVVGLAGVTSAPRADPANPKSFVVDMEFIGLLEPPTTLAEIKKSGLFNEWALVRQGRLSTMPAPDSFVRWMRTRYKAAKL